jgi:hypothetical protein
MLLPVLLIGGCVIGDQLTTLTVHPDGSADLVLFRSNLHSTEEGKRAEKELADFRASFDAREEGDFARIREAGGKVVEASWVREEAPFSNLIRAHFPTASAVEKYWSAEDEDGKIVMKTRFHSEGPRRRLAIEITVPPDKTNPSHVSPANVDQIKQAMANGISETRIALTQGAIVAAKGFTVAEDKQAALLDFTAISDVLRSGGKAELYLEWELEP